MDTTTNQREGEWMKDIKRDLDFLKSYVATLYGIEMLDYYDRTLLIGNNESIGKQKIELCNIALKKIDEITEAIKNGAERMNELWRD